MSNNTKKFVVESMGLSGIQSKWINRLKDKECNDLEMSIPVEFEGPGGTYSPEDLYALSLMNCYLATFKYIAEKSKLQYETIKGEATLTVGKGDRTSLWMESIQIDMKLVGCTNKERALLMMEKTKTQCMIINSVNTKIEFSFSVE
ncbi:MAG: OsmC family protein [Bdellovibrionales bacterium]|nr:OsmC family protein [Bdellovibrionales bacterium]